MRVKAYAAKGPKQALEPFEYEAGPLGPHKVDVRVSHCGICHSDVAMIDNDWGLSAYPLVPGHEVIGTVAAVGSDVDGIKVGRRVGVGWQSGSCGHCEWCVRGHENLCAENQGTIVHRPGGWAESVRVHWKFAVPMPEALDSAVAGPLMCAARRCSRRWCISASGRGCGRPSSASADWAIWRCSSWRKWAAT